MKFHVVGLKCAHCGAYNTCRTKGSDNTKPLPCTSNSMTAPEVVSIDLTFSGPESSSESTISIADLVEITNGGKLLLDNIFFEQINKFFSLNRNFRRKYFIICLNIVAHSNIAQ